MLPSSKELESAVLGAILSETSAFNIIESKLSEEDFSVESNAIIFRHVLELSKKREPIDMLTILESLRNSGKLEEVGGPVYIMHLCDGIGSSAHIEFHALILKQKTVERKLIKLSFDCNKKIVDGEDIGDILFSQLKEIEKLQESLIGKQATLHISETLDKSIEAMYMRIANAANGIQTGVNTGLGLLNKKTNGWQRQNLIIIAARPAMGKTAFALHFAKSAAISGTPVAIFSLEMSDISLTNRLLISESNVNPELFKSGKLSQDDIQSFESAAGTLWNLPIYIDDNSGASMGAIKAKARILNQKGKCGMIVIDYLQLAKMSDGNKSRNREQEVAEMSREAKLMAKELDIPVLLLSQLSREVEKRTDKRPMLSDLRESGAIEQDADMVCFIHRPEYYGSKLSIKGSEIYNGIEFIIAKNREGSTGCIVCQHNGSLSKIFDYDDGRYSNASPTPMREDIPIQDKDDLPF